MAREVMEGKEIIGFEWKREDDALVTIIEERKVFYSQCVRRPVYLVVLWFFLASLLLLYRVYCG